MQHFPQEVHFHIHISCFGIYGYEAKGAIMLCIIVAGKIQVLSRIEAA